VYERPHRNCGLWEQKGGRLTSPRADTFGLQEMGMVDSGAELRGEMKAFHQRVSLGLLRQSLGWPPNTTVSSAFSLWSPEWMAVKPDDYMGHSSALRRHDSATLSSKKMPNSKALASERSSRKRESLPGMSESCKQYR